MSILEDIARLEFDGFEAYVSDLFGEKIEELRDRVSPEMLAELERDFAGILESVRALRVQYISELREQRKG